ncbi:hypothetical protein HHI36_017308, partial [Cryptolaemus montrouzieri]
LRKMDESLCQDDLETAGVLASHGSDVFSKEQLDDVLPPMNQTRIDPSLEHILNFKDNAAP